MLFSAIAIGSLLGSAPIMYFLEKYGIRFTVVSYGIISSIATALLPLAVEFGFIYVLLVRIFQGFSASFVNSIMGLISEKWSPLSEAGTFIALLSCAFQCGPIMTMPLAAFACESPFGWRLLYYMQAGISLVCHIFFFFFFRDMPELHRHVSDKELRKISTGRAPTAERTSVPYKEMCKDPCVIGIWLSVIGSNVGFFFSLYYGPTYMANVLGLNVKSTALATALPYIIAACLKFVVGPISDRLTLLSNKTRCIIFAAISQGFHAASIITMALTEDKLIARIAFTSGIAFCAVNIVGAFKCSQLHARQYVHFVMTVVSFSSCFITLFLPLLVSVMCPDNTPTQWSALLVFIASSIILMNLPFIFVANTNPADYTLAVEKSTTNGIHNT
ncbi:hypothetical protein WR25_12574 isoform B [Diploscapter pachys]|nr:hypothetical protein WR25_12574 isoform B [Diploscapter pachys]